MLWKSFSPGYEDENITAFVLYGRIQDVTSLSFDVVVNNEFSCTNPLEIDILSDGVIEWKSDVYSNNFTCTYGQGFGCFDSSESLSEVYIGKTPYCGKITLLPRGRFKLGAWVRNDTFAEH